METPSVLPQTDDETPQPTVAADHAPDSPPESDLSELIAQAEQRGYLRGRNESIEKLLERGDKAAIGLDADEPVLQSQTCILNNLRPSIWD